MWHFNNKEESQKLTSKCTATLTKSTLKRLIEDAYIKSGTNKSFFILVRLSVNKLLSVFPIILISLSDLLSIFFSKIRFSKHYSISQSIIGPAPHLQLNYSQVTSTLNQMQVTRLSKEANVHLAQEGVNKEVKSSPYKS